MDSIDFGTVITTTENEETQRRESQQGNVNKKEHFSKFKILLKKLKSFYCAPVTKFWFNVVGSCFNICPYINISLMAVFVIFTLTALYLVTSLYKVFFSDILQIWFQIVNSKCFINNILFVVFVIRLLWILTLNSYSFWFWFALVIFMLYFLFLNFARLI